MPTDDSGRPDLRDVADEDMAEADQAAADDDTEMDSGGGLSSRIEGLRRRVQKRQAEKQSRQRAAELRQERAKRDRQQRIEENNPQGAREQARASLRQGRLLASELGISGRQGQAVAQRLSDALEQGGQAIDSLDIDNDGDTDLFEAVEAQQEQQQRGRDLTPTIEEAEPVDAFDLTDTTTIGERPVDEVGGDPNARPIEDDLGL